MMRRFAWIAMALAALSGSAARARAADPGEHRIRTFLKSYCVDCHGGDSPEAGLAFDRFRSASDFAEHKTDLRKAITNLASGAMPPAESQRPSQADIDSIISLLSQELRRVECVGPADPGRVTIRRLNKTEYNNTVRDLLGVTVRPADDFPEDDVGYGFDNIGAVLSLPPVLLERYLGAADQLASLVIVTEDPHGRRTQPIAARDLRSTLKKGPPPFKDRWILDGLGEVFTIIDCPATGDYELRANVFGRQVGPDPVKLAFRLNNRFVQVFETKADEKSPSQIKATTRIEEGKHRLSISFLNHFVDTEAKDPAKKDRALGVLSLEVDGPIGLPPKALPAAHQAIISHAPVGKFRREAVRLMIAAFARRAFRRPPTQNEVDRYVGLVDAAVKNGDSIELGMQLAVRAILVSPDFLFRVENAIPGAGHESAERLDDFALASRLSYFLWSSMPDEELFSLAEKGTLREPRELERQVRRLIADPRAEALAVNFAHQWLETRRLDTLAPDAKRFPGFTPDLRAAMKRETELFFLTVLRENRSLLDFVDADYTFVNGPLAKHYGLAGISGESFQRVSLSGLPRGGVLTQASVLTVTSNPTRTSPVKRGKWVLEAILGTPPPPPPPNVPELKEGEGGALTGTLRQRMEQHRTNAVCASCHQRMDPLGFGLENFDAIGAWRDKDGDAPIDASGVLPGGRSFSGPAELRTVLLGKKDLFRRNLSEKLLTYALGRGLEEKDQCVVDEIAAAVEADGDRLSRLVLEVVRSTPFQNQRRIGAP